MRRPRRTTIRARRHEPHATRGDAHASPRARSTSASSTRPSRPTTACSLRVQPGEIHAVLGENGAGKSTLMKIIYGAVRPDEGEMRWNGQRGARSRNPHEARALGISMVFQHFSLFDTLTVAENVWLGLDKSLTLAEVTQRIRKVAQRVRPRRRPAAAGAHAVGRRAPAGRDRARAADRAQAADPRRADLGADAAGGARSCSSRCASSPPTAARILYISHKLDEIRALCHHCTVLRGGKVTGEVDPTQGDATPACRG